MRHEMVWRASALAFGGLACLSTVSAQRNDYVSGTSIDGLTNARLAPDRTPTLFTGDFGDCLGGESLLNITQFDTALYWDNSTILLHLDGRTNIRDEDIMLHFSLDAYGESRYSRVIDPCQNNMASLCPMRASQPIGAFGTFNVTAAEVSAIPQLAFSMPDVEGLVRIQIFANSSKTEIACFQARLKNGKTFSQPAAVSSALAALTAIATIASFATAAYGVSVAHMRTHYAHSLSVLVIFETFQSIFLSGALSLRWPAILPAWWSNFAWATGIIPAPGIIQSVNSFVGISGNASQVGGAGSTVLNNNGGLTQLIYGRLPLGHAVKVGSESLQSRSSDLLSLAARQSNGAAVAYNEAWNGAPVLPGLPLPGDAHGLAQTLSILSVPAQSAFIVAVIWTAILVAFVLVFSATLKASLEGIIALKWLKQDRLQFYRTHWLGYLIVAGLRTCLVALFPVATLALYQFATGDGASAVAVAAVILVIFLAGTCFFVWRALHARFGNGKFALSPDRILFRSARLFRFIPFVAPVRLSQLKESEFAQKPRGSLPFLRLHFVEEDPVRQSAHQDEPYIKRHGWLSARYRLSRWWFFSCWAAYQLIRACFLGGAAANPLAQVFGLFMVEILAFVMLWALNPYEGQRNTALAVWLLGLAKATTSGMSIAFLPEFNLNRIATTLIGLFMIIIQALLTAAVLVLIILGCISTWMSLYRNKEYFVMDKLDDLRIKYYDHIAESAKDEKKPTYESIRRQKPKSTFMVNTMATGNQLDDITLVPAPAPMLPHPSRHKKAHSFSTNHARRLSKIEDEDDEPIDEMKPTYTPAVRNRSRTTSVSSVHSASGLPRGNRPRKVSWSSHDFTVDRAGRQELRPSSAIFAGQSAPPISSAQVSENSEGARGSPPETTAASSIDMPAAAEEVAGTSAPVYEPTTETLKSVADGGPSTEPSANDTAAPSPAP
ncbi:Transient receptor potential (TRP) ion channel [Microdochium nivale]|nr:Transient receptor potential (TRP) ion channel [Microdochium nivale]